ncbi:nucleotide exchange factor GrpE [Thioalbus denitrificans]|uniref:Protein GrpE n=1 Tax=Thioalbus denitrificans TaxID=547122 RepID=A0A369C344_9GAMM|nr:nucleotide exchange factor GrpE [Thioalbus denitrificans]RCX28319.1 molecular chaperone GrpE [Thioalbus denitrificans]
MSREEKNRPEEQLAAGNAAPEAEQVRAEAAPEPGEAGAEPVDVETRLAEAETRAAEHWDKVVRLQAELDNQRRRLERDVEKAHRYGLEKFARELLPVRDSLEHGLEAAGSGSEELGALRDGMALTLKMLDAVLDKFGIQVVDPAGQPFNPELHEAMTMQPSAEVEPGHVLAVYQKGYLLNDRLIRPARVVVAREPAE